MESQLLKQNHAFRAVIQPDLPASNTWSGLLKKSVDFQWRRPLPKSLHSSKANLGEETGEEFASTLGVEVVQTVAVNVRSRRNLRGYLQSKIAGCHDKYGESAKVRALLCVSGGHPARRLPLLGSHLLADSADLLREASKGITNVEGASDSQQQQPELWCVENPLLNFNGSRLERKFDSGASTVVTQPPLLRGSFLQWFDKFEKEFGGRGGGGNFVVGIPCITSARNLQFWFDICGVRYQSNREAMELLSQFHESQDMLAAAAFDRFCLQYTESLLQLTRDLPNVCGLHFMPVTAKGYRQLTKLNV